MAMAVQDNNISTKRRRLFKALSTAPVVATLNPGSALAAASSMQCAAKIRAGETLVPGPVDPTSVAADPFLYQELMYWVLDVADRIPLDPADPGGPKVGMGGIDGLPAELPITVVSMNPTDPAAGPFYELDGSLFSDRFDASTPARFEVTGSTMSLYNQAGAGRLTLENTAGTMSGFAIVVTTGEDNAVPDRFIASSAVYPQAQLDVLNGASAGDPQGITASCLGSFNPGGGVGGGTKGLGGG